MTFSQRRHHLRELQMNKFSSIKGLRCGGWVNLRLLVRLGSVMSLMRPLQ